MPLRLTFEISRCAPMFRAATVSSKSFGETPASIRAARNMSPLIPEKQSRYAMRIKASLVVRRWSLAETFPCQRFESDIDCERPRSILKGFADPGVHRQCREPRGLTNDQRRTTDDVFSVC